MCCAVLVLLRIALVVVHSAFADMCSLLVWMRVRMRVLVRVRVWCRCACGWMSGCVHLRLCVRACVHVYAGGLPVSSGGTVWPAFSPGTARHHRDREVRRKCHALGVPLRMRPPRRNGARHYKWGGGGAVIPALGNAKRPRAPRRSDRHMRA